MFFFFIAWLFPALFLAQSPIPPVFDPLPYVNPFIGTGGHGHTYPGAAAPFGLVQLSPDTRLEGWDGCSGYHYTDSLIYGFSHTHLSGTGVPDYCDILFQPYIGETQLDNRQYASPFQKKNEKAEAGYYSVLLDKHGIQAELTATERVGVHRYTFPKNRETARLLIDLRHRDEVLDAHLQLVGDREIAGYRVSKAWAQEQHIYFVARFSQPFNASKLLNAALQPMVAEPSVQSKSVIGLLDFYNQGVPLVVTVAVSGVSIEGARKNLDAEAPGFDFDFYKKQTQDKWRRQLSKIEVEGGTTDQKTTFYTALYHTMLAPNIWNDADGRYRGRDGAIHQAKGHDVYTVFSLWDTYRAGNPLYTILEPKRTNDFVQTFLRQYEQGGLLPIWELSANETDCMIGNHAIPVIYDAWSKGIRDYDANLALQAMTASARQDRLGLRWYRRMGYVPSDKESESVSKTLEYAYDDWCIAQMAGALEQDDLYEEFIRRAQYWKNLYDPATGFFRAKNNAAWHQPFDPREVNFNFTEANAWQYRFAVPQDVNTLMDLLGGPAAFAAQLDSLFTAPMLTTGRNQADITGLIGQYAHGNEPSHHVAYLYNFAGQPWKTQARVRQIMDEQYANRPDGLSGNEDCGQMSAWLVLSALGVYPVTPGSHHYVVGTPWFEKATIRLDGRKTFTIQAKGVGPNRFYVQGLRLNGQPWANSWLLHRDLVNGGELVFELGDKPAAWASAPENCPAERIITAPIVPTPFVAQGSRAFRDEQTVALGCLDQQTEIFYTLDGSLPSELSTPYRRPFKIKETSRLRFRAVRCGAPSAVAEATFTRMQSNLHIERYNTAYSPQYTGGGDNGLIDGIRGAADFRTGDWQGYEGVNLDVVIDLGKARPVQRVHAGFLQDENAWIFLPAALRVEVSADGKNFTPAGEASNPISPREKGVVLSDLTVDLKGQSVRYLRVIGVSLGKCPDWHKGAGNACWVFSDEILVE